MQASASIEYQTDPRSGGVTSARLQLGTVAIASGSGAPGTDLDGLQSGSLYLNNSGSAGSLLYVKSPNGWSAIA